MVWCKSRLSFCRHFLEEKNIYALAACEGTSTFLQRCFLSCKSEGHLGRHLQTLGTQRHFNLFLTIRLVNSLCRAVGISLYGLEITGLWQHKERGLDDTGSVLSSFVHGQPFHWTSVKTGDDQGSPQRAGHLHSLLLSMVYISWSRRHLIWGLNITKISLFWCIWLVVASYRILALFTALSL